MSYPSVDTLQRTLAEKVFHYAVDRKKASGRALGTLIEIITYYTLKSWGLRDSLAIERALPEFGNPDITHNVEYSLHPILNRRQHTLSEVALPLTAAKLRKSLFADTAMPEALAGKGNDLLSKDEVLRNACVIGETADSLHVVNLDRAANRRYEIALTKLHRHPYAIFECKRVGVEEGMSKGPQTIEKAKQGAYVARTVSSLQKIRLRDGRVGGVFHRSDGTLHHGPYEELLEETVASDSPEILREFILTVGVVSNHGNWFDHETSSQNKEMKVLAQSYDWLLFLTDNGLSDFISELLLKPTPALAPAREAFLASYSGKSGKNRFTKVKMALAADAILQTYFHEHAKRIEGWFNVITPRAGSLKILRNELTVLDAKNWAAILAP